MSVPDGLNRWIARHGSRIFPRVAMAVNALAARTDSTITLGERPLSALIPTVLIIDP